MGTHNTAADGYEATLKAVDRVEHLIVRLSEEPESAKRDAAMKLLREAHADAISAIRELGPSGRD